MQEASTNWSSFANLSLLQIQSPVEIKPISTSFFINNSTSTSIKALRV